ncbi:MAG: hypothetical protein ACREVB_04775 [Burkholderiales bacterium]
MIAGVPATRGQIETATERDAIIDHHDFLMMRACYRVRVVVADANAPVRLPAEAVDRRKLALGVEEHRVIPDEDAHVEAPVAAREGIEEVTHQQRLVAVLDPAIKACSAIEIPGEDQDRAARALSGRRKRLEVRLSVDQQRESISLRGAPQFSPGRSRLSSRTPARLSTAARGKVERLHARW